MKTNDNKLSYIRVNDIFDELIDENKRLKQCLNVFLRFKSFVDLISNKLKTSFESNDWQKFENLNKEVEEVFKQNQINGLNEPQIMSGNLSQSPKLETRSSNKPSKNGYKIQTIRRNLSDNEDEVPKRMGRGKKQPSPQTTIDGFYICGHIGCGALLKNKKTLCSHQRIHRGKRYVCKLEGCAYKALTYRDLKTHMNVHKGIRPFKCDHCEKTYHCPKILSHHISSSHTTTDQTFICDFKGCNKQFNNKTRYLVHKRNCHHLNDRFFCSVEDCPFRTTSNFSLNKHMKTKHSNEKPFRCEVEGCDKSYKSKANLEEHFSNAHRSERNFICEFPGCKSRFKTYTKLRIHQLAMHLNQAQISCEWPGCDYTCKTKDRLKEHQVIHSQERKYPCNWPQCSKNFKTKPHLKTHMRIHTCDKRYACSWPGCYYRCTDCGNLRKHYKQVHEK